MSIIIRRAAALLAVCLTAALLAGCSGEPARTLTAPDGTVCRVYLDSRGAVRRIELSEQTEGASTYVLRPDSRMRDSGDSLVFIDVNFDGRLDVRLATRYTGGNTYYTTYIRGDAGYYTVSALDALPSPTVDADTKTISAPYSRYTVEPETDDFPEVYISEAGTEHYSWQQGALRLTARDSCTYYSESDIYCIAKWRTLDDGTLDAVDEHWLDEEQYAKLEDAPQLKK